MTQEINEISSKVLQSYKQKAAAQLAQKTRGRPSAASIKQRVKRSDGITAASGKIKKEFDNKWAAQKAEHAQNVAHVNSKIPETLNQHGYHKIASGPNHDLYTKVHPSHGVVTWAKHNTKPFEGGYHNVLSLGSSTGWQGSGDRISLDSHASYGGSKNFDKVTTPQEHIKHISDKLKEHDEYHQKKGLEEQAKLEGEMINESRESSLASATNRYHQEHEQAQELLKSIHKHLNAHKSEAKNHVNYKGEKTGIQWGHVGDLQHYNHQLKQIHDQLAQAGEYAHENNAVHRAFGYTVQEENDWELSEGRGRPRKNPLPAKPKTSLDDDDEDEEPDTGPEPNQHIMNQIRKAADSGLKPYHVTYLNGQKHPVTRSQARSILNKYGKLKPFAKEEMQADIAKSHENLLKHL